MNGNPLVKKKPSVVVKSPAPVPKYDTTSEVPPGTRTRFLKDGPEKFSKWIRDQKPLLVTDTTLRDAHQSLLATRMRTHDMLRIAEAYSRLCPQLFSLEMWGGATFDTSMRFLKECPWHRLVEMRARVPNILFQMLLRASNAVGYTNYPDNVVRAFVKEAVQAGVDVFRVFDALNWVPNMKVAMEAVVDAGGICEPAICYTGDLLDPTREKYTLQYYVDLAKELEKMGAHILAIKDMAGLCKPYAVERLVKALKQEVGLPIHFHTHDMSGVQGGAILKGAEAGLDIADAALAPMSGMTSQPNLNSVVECCGSARARQVWTPPFCVRWPITGPPCAACTSRSRPACSHRTPTSICTKCPAVRRRTCTNRQPRWDWRTAGRPSARCTLT